MKGFRIAINILLGLQLLVFVLLAIFIPSQMEAAFDALGEDAQANNDNILGAIIGVIFGAFFLAIFYVMLFAIAVVYAVLTIPFIIIYNVKKYPRLGLGIATLVGLNIPAGILMLIQRKKYLAQQSQQQPELVEN